MVEVAAISELVILGEKRKMYIDSLKRFAIVWPTTLGFLTINEISDVKQKTTQTIRTRMGRYGDTDPRVLFDESLPHSHTVLSAIPVKWDRSKCRRNGINCTQYAECQSMRIGISEREWVAPDNTDECYAEPETSANLYPSSLAALAEFGIYQAY